MDSIVYEKSVGEKHNEIVDGFEHLGCSSADIRRPRNSVPAERCRAVKLPPLSGSGMRCTLTFDPMWPVLLTQPLQVSQQIVPQKVLEAWSRLTSVSAVAFFWCCAAAISIYALFVESVAFVDQRIDQMLQIRRHAGRLDASAFISCCPRCVLGYTP